MSRVGRKIIEIPSGVNVTVAGNLVSIENSGKKLEHVIPPGLTVKKEDSTITVYRENDSRELRSLHGLTRTILSNMVIGVKDNFTKKLEMVGRGKRANVQGNKLVLELGFSHPVDYHIPEGIEIKAEKNILEILGIDKQKVGEVAAEIRDIQPPEPYKGAGIRYADEQIKKKAGKSAVGGGFTGAGK